MCYVWSSLPIALSLLLCSLRIMLPYHYLVSLIPSDAVPTPELWFYLYLSHPLRSASFIDIFLVSVTHLYFSLP